ncbi:MAG: hypothetical protein H5T61_12985 [Thermoflexales bacterium]|nr:hypothetical protein [Thermoflexales bacterium]
MGAPLLGSMPWLGCPRPQRVTMNQVRVGSTHLVEGCTLNLEFVPELQAGKR